MFASPPVGKPALPSPTFNHTFLASLKAKKFASDGNDCYVAHNEL